MASSIRVLSANLWLGKADPDGVAQLIRENDVDVFAAQELGHDVAYAISEELPFGYLEPREDHLGLGIALRAPAPHSVIPLDTRTAHRVVLQPQNWPVLSRPIDLVNVHIHAPHQLRPFPSLLVRRRQLKALERDLDATPAAARLLVGDLNSTPIWGVYRQLMTRFVDGAVRCAAREGGSPEATWGPTSESPRLLRIDHALVNGLEIENFRVVDIPGSDHSGLLFDCFPHAADESA